MNLDSGSWLPGLQASGVWRTALRRWVPGCRAQRPMRRSPSRPASARRRARERLRSRCSFRRSVSVRLRPIDACALRHLARSQRRPSAPRCHRACGVGGSPLFRAPPCCVCVDWHVRALFLWPQPVESRGRAMGCACRRLILAPPPGSVCDCHGEASAQLWPGLARPSRLGACTPRTRRCRLAAAHPMRRRACSQVMLQRQRRPGCGRRCLLQRRSERARASRRRCWRWTRSRSRSHI